MFICKKGSIVKKGRSGKVITASKFFFKKVIEVEDFPYYHTITHQSISQKSIGIKSWSTQTLLNSFVKFSISDNTEAAIARPNVSYYLPIIKKFADYFSANDLYFKTYPMNENSSLSVSRLTKNLPHFPKFKHFLKAHLSTSLLANVIPEPSLKILPQGI